MTLTYKPIRDPSHVPTHVRNAFAERCPSNPPSDGHPALGWHWQTQDIGTLQRYHWLRSPDEKWSVAMREA